MKAPSDLQLLERCHTGFVAALDFVTPDQLSVSTPCPEWNVSELLDHITGGNRFTLQILSGESAQVAVRSARDSFSENHQPVPAAASSAAEQLERFLQADLARTYDHVVGALSGQEILKLRIHDLSIHTWDLLQAVHPKKGLDPVYVRWAIDELADPNSLTARHIAVGFERPSKSFELLLAFGRTRAATG